jgi:hypothetical protein
LTLIATDVVGNASTNSITVSKSALGLVIDPVGDNLWQDKVTVTGTIDAGGYAVWVNGVQATQSGTSWTASNVPTTPGGTAVFQARAIPNSDNGGNGSGGSGGAAATYGNPGNPSSSTGKDADSQIDKPWQLFLEHYETAEGGWVINTGPDNYHYYMTHDSSMQFDHDKSAHGTSSYNWSKSDDSCWFTADRNDTYSSNSPGPGTDYQIGNYASCASPDSAHSEGANLWTPIIVGEHCHVNLAINRTIGWPDSFAGSALDTYGSGQYHRTADAKMRLLTGGKGTKKNLWILGASAAKLLKKISQPFSDGYDPIDNESIPPTGITIQDIPLDANGQVRFAFENNSSQDVTPKVSGNDFYTFSVGASKQCLPQKITFEDSPASQARPWHGKFELDAVCGDDTNSILARFTYWVDVDTSGGITIGSTDGTALGCGTIVTNAFEPYNSGSKVAGITVNAYFIGCCDGILRWHQRGLEDSDPPPQKNGIVPYDDNIGAGADPNLPWYYRDKGYGFGNGMDEHTSDYLGPCE